MAEFELEQGKSQKTLDKADSGSLSEMAASELTDTGEQESTFSKEGFKSALESKDAAQISAQLNGLTAEDAKSIAADSELMGMIENLEGEIRNSVYDRIYVGVQDVDVFCQIFLKRFNVAMGMKYSTDEDALEWAKKLVKNDEKPWSVNGLIRMYALFSKLPPAHLENLKIVMTTDTVNGGYGGAAYSGKGVYYFDYADSDCNTFLDSLRKGYLHLDIKKEERFSQKETIEFFENILKSKNIPFEPIRTKNKLVGNFDDTINVDFKIDNKYYKILSFNDLNIDRYTSIIKMWMLNAIELEEKNKELVFLVNELVRNDKTEKFIKMLKKYGEVVKVTEIDNYFN